MTVHQFIKIIDNNIVYFFLFSYHFFFRNIFWYIDWIFLFIFITKNVNANGIYLFSFVQISPIWVQSSLFAKSLSAFVIFLGVWCTGFMYLIKHHLKHSLSSLFLKSLFFDGLTLWVISYNRFQLMNYTLNY